MIKNSKQAGIWLRTLDSLSGYDQPLKGRTKAPGLALLVCSDCGESCEKSLRKVSPNYTDIVREGSGMDHWLLDCLTGEYGND